MEASTTLRAAEVTLEFKTGTVDAGNTVDPFDAIHLAEPGFGSEKSARAMCHFAIVCRQKKLMRSVVRAENTRLTGRGPDPDLDTFLWLSGFLRFGVPLSFAGFRLCFASNTWWRTGKITSLWFEVIVVVVIRFFVILWRGFAS